MIKKTLSVLLLFFLVTTAADAHKFCTSLTQIEYNSKTRAAEVVMNVFFDDWQLALSNQEKRKIRSDDKDFGALSAKYLSSHFQLKSRKNRLAKMQFVGFEFNKDIVTLYVEFPLPEGLDGAEVNQAILLDLYSEQTNMVNLMNGAKKKSLVFRDKAGAQRVSF